MGKRLCSNCGEEFVAPCNQTIYCSIACRFWPKVRIGGLDQCWGWLGRSMKRDGYGQFFLNRRQLGAHQVAWMLTKGEIPEGLCVLHTCDNPACCNPLHLFLGTNGDNIKDRVLKGRSSGPKGEQNSFAKLTQTDAAEILSLKPAGRRDYVRIAASYGVSWKCIWELATRRTWRHV